MMTMLCISDYSGIISTLIASSAGLLGVCLSFRQWKDEKKKQRETESNELLTRLVGRCLGNLDYVVLQFRKFKKKLEGEVKDLNSEWTQLQKDIEPLVKEAEEICNESELKIHDEKVITSFKAVENAYIALITECSKKEADISTKLEGYHNKKDVFMKEAKEYLRSLKK